MPRLHRRSSKQITDETTDESTVSDDISNDDTSNDDSSNDTSNDDSLDDDSFGDSSNDSSNDDSSNDTSDDNSSNDDTSDECRSNDTSSDDSSNDDTSNDDSPDDRSTDNSSNNDTSSDDEESTVTKGGNQIVLYLVTRDYRTEDNLTLYAAYSYAMKHKMKLCPVFRFDDKQIDPNENKFFSNNAVQFLVEALELHSKNINLSFVTNKSDQQFAEAMKRVGVNRIFIAKDFSPFARERVKMLSKICPVEEIDDITVYPIEEYSKDGTKVHVKLKYFIDYVTKLGEPEVKKLDINWRKSTSMMPGFKGFNMGFHRYYQPNKSLLVHPSQLESLLDELPNNIKGYSDKKTREQVGDPRVSYLSAFIKFGLVSIRKVHSLARDKSISTADSDAFVRELFFRDFYYAMAWFQPDKVFYDPNWSTKEGCPEFISSADAKEFSVNSGISCKSSKDAQEIYNNFQKANTEYDLINAGINQLVTTGYMLNRLRMLVASYLTRDHGLWWKYGEKFYANHLTDYDWTINTMNHQNIAKVGLYPKYTQDFSIKRQETLNKSDKQSYIKQWNN